MNTSLFKSYLKPIWGSWVSNDFDSAAEAIATAYEIANIGSAKTFFGSTLIYGNKQILKNFLKIGFQLNYSLTVKTPPTVVESGYTMFATGFCLYWIGSQFTPFPPMPPMFAPAPGTNVIFPGVPIGFDKSIKIALEGDDVNTILDKLCSVLLIHKLTITGIYSGIAPAFPSPIPLLLPWKTLF
ncbi:hypothetical protein [Microcystis phage Mel-JY01]